MAKRRPSGDGMVRKRDDGRWEGRIVKNPDNDPGLSLTMVRSIHTILHHALKAATEERLLPSNPADKAVPPKLTGKPKGILNNDQLDTLMEAIAKDELWHDFFYTELTTGLRRGELCGLKWEDFDSKAGTLKICRTIRTEKGGALEAGDTKTYAGKRIILLPSSTAKLLCERGKSALTEWIFPDLLKLERPTHPASAYRQLKKILTEAGLPNIRFHDLRHPYVKLKTKNNCKTAITSMRFHACNCCLYIHEKGSKRKQY